MSMFRFQPSAITVKAGTVVFFLDNTDGVFAGGPGTQHSLSIGLALDEPLAASSYVHTGAPAVFTVEGLVPGRYVIWCAFPGHADHGMVGTLTVKP